MEPPLKRTEPVVASTVHESKEVHVMEAAVVASERLRTAATTTVEVRTRR
jgi:hypothetical protein